MIDLASDTLTKPSPAMREAMARAEVGDDFYREDPTVNALEWRIAEVMGKEAAMFVSSGTMGNLIGIRLHCGPGDEFLVEADSHIIRYEQGGYAQLFGIAAQAVKGDRGLLKLEQLRDKIRPATMHCARTRLVCLENTHNCGGGSIHPYESVQSICAWAKEQGLACHLDGARLFNAEVATGISAAKWAEPFDTATVCFSKGLGAPVGSALCGTQEAIDRARWHRSALGGAMRQSGIIAAGALYALDNNVERLAEDHANAQRLAQAVRETKGLSLCDEQVETNIVFINIDEERGTAAQFCERLQNLGVRMIAFNPQSARAVTHMDVSKADVLKACNVMGEAVGG